MTAELLACPFCGSDGEELGRFCDPSEGHDNSGPSRRIQCYGCHIEAPFYDSEAEAIAAWNRRAIPAAPSDVAGRMMQEFYVSAAYDPHAARPADTVQAAIAFTLQALSHDREVMREALEKMVNASENVGRKHFRELAAETLASLKGGAK